MSVIQTAYQQLLDGVPGDQVKAQMRQTYKTLGSLNTTMSHVRLWQTRHVSLERHMSMSMCHVHVHV